MSTRLEQFVRDHREDFDDEVPSSGTWSKIENSTFPEKKMGSPVISMRWMRWSAAALILIALGTWLRMKTDSAPNSKNGQKVAVLPEPPAKTKQTDTSKQTSPEPVRSQLAQTDKQVKEKIGAVQNLSEQSSDVNEELFHFAKIVEIRQRELKTMAEDEPLLYKQFSGDVGKLDSVYHVLENKLSKNQNSEELLEAMIENLQLQMRLLNHQLSIIKQLNQSKKSVYDKAYQSI